MCSWQCGRAVENPWIDEAGIVELLDLTEGIDFEDEHMQLDE